MLLSCIIKLIILICCVPFHAAGEYIHTGLFWHLSDVHVDLDYNKHGCKGSFADQKCDSSLNLWINALNATRQVLPTAPDFVIFSGDSVAHGITELDVFKLTMEKVAAALKAFFPSNENQQTHPIPVIVSLGNHDVYPDSNMSVEANDENRLRWCSELGSSPTLWGNWVANASDADVDHFNDGCYYSRILRVGSTGKMIRFISLNGLIYSRRNHQTNPEIPDPLGQFQWFIEQLQSARREKQKAIIVMHFPLGAPENSPVKFRHLHDIYNKRLFEIFVEFADVVALGLFGHQHTDSFRFISSRSGDAAKEEPLTPLFITPSISPLHFYSLGAFNPRIRLFNYSITDAFLFHLNDYYQYYVDLSNVSASKDIQWRLEYTASNAYNLPDLSARALKGLLTRLESNLSLWCTYWYHELGSLPHDSGPCPELQSPQHCRHLCTMRYIQYAALDACLQGCTAASFSPHSERGAEEGVGQWNTLPIVALVIIGFLAILLTVVLLMNPQLCRRGGLTSWWSAGGSWHSGLSSLIVYRPRAATAESAMSKLSIFNQIDELEARRVLKLNMEGEAYDADANSYENKAIGEVVEHPRLSGQDWQPIPGHQSNHSNAHVDGNRPDGDISLI